MTPAPDGDSNALSTLAPLLGWWRALPLRERRLAAAAAAALGLFLLWSLAVQPAWRTLASARTEGEALHAQSQTMRALAAEAAELRAAPTVSREQSAVALKAATERLGDKARLALQGDRAVLTVTGVSTAQLRDWLTEARSAARARPLEATLARAAVGYSGTVIVAVGGSSVSVARPFRRRSFPLGGTGAQRRRGSR